MHKFFQPKWVVWVILLTTIVIALIASLLEKTFPNTYMISLSRHGGAPKAPLFIVAFLILTYLGIVIVLNYKKSKNYLLKKGFLAATAEILSITQNGSFGSPQSHSLYLVLQVAVKPVGKPVFKTAIKTSIRENGNAAFEFVQRVPDYKVGDTIAIFYHPQSHEAIIAS